jgi:hypothetical protein
LTYLEVMLLFITDIRAPLSSYSYRTWMKSMAAT